MGWRGGGWGEERLEEGKSGQNERGKIEKNHRSTIDQSTVVFLISTWVTYAGEMKLGMSYKIGNWKSFICPSNLIVRGSK